MTIKPLPQPGDRLHPMAVLEGACVLLRMAEKINDQCKVQNGPYIKLRRVDLAAYAQALRHTAHMIDFLVGAIERGEQFDTQPVKLTR